MCGKHHPFSLQEAERKRLRTQIKRFFFFLHSLVRWSDNTWNPLVWHYLPINKLHSFLHVRWCLHSLFMSDDDMKKACNLFTICNLLSWCCHQSTSSQQQQITNPQIESSYGTTSPPPPSVKQISFLGPNTHIHI